MKNIKSDISRVENINFWMTSAFFHKFVLFHFTLCKADTCPTEWYMSNGNAANLRVRLISSDWLKVEFWVDGPMAADTFHGERLLFVGLPLCDVYQKKKKKKNFQPIRICLPHDDRGMTVGHSLALHNVHFRTSEAGNLFFCEQKVWVFIFLVRTKGILWYHNYWVLRKCFVLRSCHLLRISVGGVMREANVT